MHFNLTSVLKHQPGQSVHGSAKKGGHCMTFPSITHRPAAKAPFRNEGLYSSFIGPQICNLFINLAKKCAHSKGGHAYARSGVMVIGAG